MKKDGFQIILANAHQVKAMPGRKTDELDSQWLARVFSAGLIKPLLPKKKSILGTLGEADIPEPKICLDKINRLEE